MKYKRTQKRSKQMWQRVEKFSIRKFSFGAASCLIGAITVLGPSSQIAEANGITAYEANGDKVTLYAHGEDVYNLRRTSTSIYNAFRMNVDTSKYTKENPVIRVTLTYNAPDNPNEKAPIFWSGRPFHWFTVPEGTEELGNDNKFSLTNANGTAEFNDWSSWGTNSRFVQGTNVTNLGPFRRKKNNDTTKEMLGIWPRESIDAEFNKVLGLNDDRWYDNSGMPTQDIMKDLRAKSQSIYLDWEKRAAGTVTVTYTTKVKDPEKTKELTIGMGVYQELNGQQYARVETIKLPVLYKLNEVFEPKVPERTGVANPNQLSDDEVKVIKEKIWNANQDNTSTLLPADSNAFQENVKDKTENGVNSIEIDKNTGTATITYKDDTKDVIPGTSLIYQTPDAENPSQGNNGTYIYRVSPYPVGNLNNISLEEIVAGLNKFKEINGIKTDENDVITSVGDGVSTNFIGKKLSPYINKGERYGTISIIEYGKYTGVSIPKDAVFKLKPQFDVDAARAEANKVIDSLANLYPNEQTKYKNQIGTATTREAIENVINTAKTTDNENAVELAKMKKEANDTINALNYLTSAEKEEAIAKINTATIKQNDDVDKVYDDTHPDTDVNREATKARLTSVVDALVKKDLETARTKAKETINGIPDKDLSSDKKTEYITAINNATKVGPVSEEGTVLNLVEKAQKEAADALAKRRKEEADKVRQQYKDMIAAIPGLTEEEKKQYDEAIDNATSTDEMASIVEFAKLTGDRKTAVAEIEKLEHLNNNQKQSFKDLVENSANKEDIENYVSQAKQLNSKMKQLHDLATEARKIKPENGTPQDKYTNAAADKQTAFNNALADAESVLNKQTGADESISTVENLFKKLETAINNLQPDGEKVKVDVDKSALKAEYDKGKSVKESPLYKNSTDEGEKTAQQRKDEYDKKLVAAKTILDDKDAEQTDVDNALEDLLSAKADLNGKEAEFTLSKKDGAVPISVAPAVGVVVSKPEDQKLIKDKIVGIPEGSTVIYNPIQEKGGKTVVPVKVTHENVSKEIEIEVVQSVASKVTPTAGTAELSEVPAENSKVTKLEDVEKIKQAVTVPEGTTVTGKELVDGGKVVTGTNQTSNGGANNEGKPVVKVEVTYGDGSKDIVEVPVVKKEKAFTVGVKDSTKPVEITGTPTAGTALTPADQNTVKENLTVDGAPLKDSDTVVIGNVETTADGSTVVPVTVTRDGKSETIKVEVTKKSDTTSDQGNQEGSGSQGDQTGQGGTGSQGDQAGQGGTGSQNDQNGQGDSNSTPTNKTELEKAKEKAKSDLAQAAAKEKAEIDADEKLSEDEKAQAKDKVDEAKKAAEANIDKATTPEEVAKATEEGKKAIDAVHQITPDQAKKDLTDAANAEKGEIGGDTTLTDKEKEALKAKVDEVKKAAEDKINNAKTPEEIAKATEEGKKAIADVYNPQTAKGQSTSVFKPELDLQTALVSGKVTVEKGKDLTDEEILKQLALADGLTAKVISKPSTTETGTKEAEVEVTLANGTKVTVKVPVEVVDSLGTADKDNDLAKAKEDAKKQVEDAAKKKLDEIKKDTGLTEEQKQKAEEEINKVKEDANKAIDEASSAGTAKQIADQAKENIEKYDPKADAEVKKPDVTNLDEEKAKAKAEILEEAQKRIDEIKNNKDLSDEAKQKAIEEINKAKDKAIEDINKGQSKDEINAAKEAGIHKINEVQPEGSIASKFEPKVPENKVEVENSAKLSDEEREQVRQNIEGANTFPDGTTVVVKPDGTAVITYKDGSSDTISKDKLVTPANKEIGTIASRTEPVIPGKTQVGNTTKLTPAEQAAVKKAVEEANNFPAGTTVEVRPDGTVVITYPDKSVDTITGDKLVEKGSKQETPKVQTDAEKNPAQVPGNFVPVENTRNLTQTEQDTVAAKVKEANPAATDVKVSKDGTATLTYGDGSVNTIPGTSLVVAKDTDNEATTQAAQNPAVVPATTEVGNAHSLTPEEQAAVTAKVQAANPAATDVKVSKDGTATLTYSDGSVNTIPGTSLVVQKEETSTQEQPTIAEKTKVIIPANPTKVAEATRLTDEEKEAVKKAVVDANGFGSDVKVEVAGDGTATIVFKDGSAITIPGNKLVAQDPKAQDSTKPTAEKSTVKAPAQRVDVKDITHLTDEEKEKVKVAILQANGSALDGATINVAGDGTATITFPDGSVVTILGKDTVQQSAKGESVTQEATPEYKPETTPGGDNGGNTGSSDANAGGGSQAGGQANTGSQNPAQSQASTEKESAKKAIEKAAKDKQDEIKGSPLSDKEKAELLARVEAEKQAALKEIENAKTVEDVKEAETIGVQAIAMVTVPKRPVAPNAAAPQATSAPQATAGTMQDVTYQSPARKQLPNTGSASSAALASLGLVAATSGFALLGRKTRRRK